MDPRALHLPSLLQVQRSRNSQRRPPTVYENASSESGLPLRSDNARRHSPGCRVCHPSHYVCSGSLHGVLKRTKRTATVKRRSNSKSNNSSPSGRNKSASVPSSNSNNSHRCNSHKSWSVNAPCSSSNRAINHPRLRACPLRHPSNRVRLLSALLKAARSNVRNNSNFRQGSNLPSSKALCPTVVGPGGTDRPTISLDRISLVASSCGYSRGHIEPQAFPVHRSNFVRQSDIAFVNKQLENTRKNRSFGVNQTNERKVS